jgi:hypothetical protein
MHESEKALDVEGLLVSALTQKKVYMVTPAGAKEAN